MGKNSAGAVQAPIVADALSQASSAARLVVGAVCSFIVTAKAVREGKFDDEQMDICLLFAQERLDDLSAALDAQGTREKLASANDNDATPEVHGCKGTSYAEAVRYAGGKFIGRLLTARREGRLDELIKNGQVERRAFDFGGDNTLVELERELRRAKKLDNDDDRTKAEYLELDVDSIKRTVARSPFGEADFDAKAKAWALFHNLFEARETGRTLAELMDRFDVTENNLHQRKLACNDVLRQLRIEVDCNGRGIWSLISFDPDPQQ